MKTDGVIAGEYTADEYDRQAPLERARQYSLLSIPAVQPPESFNPDEILGSSYQSLGARIVINAEGKLMLALFTPGSPWYRRVLAPGVRYDPNLSADDLAFIDQKLYIQELQIQSALDTSNYRNMMRHAIRQELVTGSSCIEITDDFGFKVHRLDNYVVRRDADSKVKYTIVCEKIDPLSLSEDDFAKSELRMAEFANKPYKDRLVKVYTKAERQKSGGWVVSEEVNGNVIRQRQQPYSPFLVGAYDLIPGEHYGRGFVECNLSGDLRSYNGATKGLVEGLAAMTRLLVGIDPMAKITPDELERAPNGHVFNTQVRDGTVQGIGFVKTDKYQDLAFARSLREDIKGELSAAGLLETELQPTGERVTATQVMRVAREVSDAMGSIYVNIADDLQRPLLEYTIWHLEREKVLVPLPKGSTSIQIITGVEALTRQQELERLNVAISGLAALGQEAMSRINIGTLVDRMMYALGIDTVGLVKSEEQVRAEIEQQMVAAAAQQAVPELAKAGGQIAVEQAKGQM